MMWAIVYQPTITEWRLHPQIFATKDSAAYAAANWPELLAFNHKRIVPIGCEIPACKHGRLQLRPMRLTEADARRAYA